MMSKVACLGDQPLFHQLVEVEVAVCDRRHLHLAALDPHFHPEGESAVRVRHARVCACVCVCERVLVFQKGR